MVVHELNYETPRAHSHHDQKHHHLHSEGGKVNRYRYLVKNFARNSVQIFLKQDFFSPDFAEATWKKICIGAQKSPFFTSDGTLDAGTERVDERSSDFERPRERRHLKLLNVHMATKRGEVCVQTGTN